MVEDLNVLMYLLAFAAAFFGGLVDSMAGGGGLVTVPILMALNLPPKMVLGTNKFQSSFGSLTSAYYYTRHKLADIKTAFIGIIFTFIGAAIGTYTVRLVSNSFLSNIIPFILLIMAVYMIFNKNLGMSEKKQRLSYFVTFMLLGLLIGFYDGFFGPGTGNFWTLGLVMLLGMNLRKATAYTKIMNFTSNIVALIIFATGGFIYYKLGLVMALGQFLGARLGAKLVIKNGEKLIRPLFITIVMIMAIYLLYKQYI